VLGAEAVQAVVVTAIVVRVMIQELVQAVHPEPLAMFQGVRVTIAIRGEIQGL